MKTAFYALFFVTSALSLGLDLFRWVRRRRAARRLCAAEVQFLADMSKAFDDLARLCSCSDCMRASADKSKVLQ